MSIFVRIWFFFSLVLVLVLALMLYTVNEQIKPNIRQVVEDTLAENVNIIAQLVAEDVYYQKVQHDDFQQKIQMALSRELQANIWQMPKKQIHQQIYITNAQGIVIYDSTAQAVGQDYSQWNDVYLTLRGRYGARSTRQNPDDPNSTIMFIAAPIIWQNQLIGVISVGKPNYSVQPYIQRAKHYMLQQAFWIAFASLILSSMVAFWLRHSIDKVRHYAQALAPIQHAPYFYSAKELNAVTQAISDMRVALEDRAYVENYINTLTHELKSPLTAIQANAELLQEDIPYAHQQQFAQQIEQQSQRLYQLIERMLLLTRLEKAPYAFEFQRLNFSQLLLEIMENYQNKIQQAHHQLSLHIMDDIYIESDKFWLSQVIYNVLDNAIDFCDGQLWVSLNIRQHKVQLEIINQGQHIPDFALSQIFERYFSLPRPHTQQRSSGIGLTLVKQVLLGLHGDIFIENITEMTTADDIKTPCHGVRVCIYFDLIN